MIRQESQTEESSTDLSPLDRASKRRRHAPRGGERRRGERGARRTIEGLNAYYGSHHVVKDLDIEFAAQRGHGDHRPSGSGKSTVVRCINRMHEEIPGARAEGKVTLDELDVYAVGVDVTAVRRLIGMVFQKPNPFPTMSIFDNVAAGLQAHRDTSRGPARAGPRARCAAWACGRRSRTG